MRAGHLTGARGCPIIPGVRTSSQERSISDNIFPRWTNKLRALVLVILLIAPAYVVLLVAYGASTEATDVGYAPVQPIPYSHALHAGELGIDCLYCHTSVDEGAHASIPPTRTCINCHSTGSGIRRESAKLTLLHEAFYGSEQREAGFPIPWVRVHDLPDYAYFNHSAHVERGVGCVACHGRIDRMEVVYQAEPLSMSWCLECHRDPGPRLRPLDQITNTTWQPPPGEDGIALGQRLMEAYGIRDEQYMQNCSLCHR